MKQRNIAARRQFLKTMAAATGTLAVAPALTGCTPARFKHGVASGDPLKDRVIIWTRVSPRRGLKVLVAWEVSKDPQFRRLLARGQTFTDESVDFTVKIDVEGLKPGNKYFYRFHTSSAVSPTGVTRTLPDDDIKELSFAVFSCANYPAGYFNVYAEAAKRASELDYALHLGDYLYEYARGGYASESASAMNREVEPAHELLALADYRMRYAQYRTDADLQAAHRKLPFICVWDDHEITNDTWKEGAENHNEGEGDFDERKDAAIQAYYEWMPIREVDEREKIYRSFDFGKLLSLHMLDTRVIARDEQLSYFNYFTAEGSFDAAAFTNDISDPNRHLLGADQVGYLQQKMVESAATWQVLGQQVLMAPLVLPAPLTLQQISLEDYQALLGKAQTDPASLSAEEIAVLNAPSVPLNLDAWDGYPAAREQVLQTAVALDKNLISLAGDTHNAWASDLNTLDGTPAGVEFATSSVSSPGFEEYLVDIVPDLLAGALVQFAEPLKYANTQHRGFMILTISHQRAMSKFVFIDTVKSKDYSVLSEREMKLAVLPGAAGRRVLPV